MTLSIALSASALPQDRSGSYLAARQAVIDGNHAEAASYFEQALRADRDNPELISNAVLARAALGDWNRAIEIASGLPADSAGRELVNIIEQVGRVIDGNYTAAIEAVADGRGAGPLVDDMARAWLMLGTGEVSSAFDLLGDLANAGTLADIARYHLALVRAAVGDFEGADAILSGAEFGPLPANARGLQAHAQILGQLGRTEDALAMLDAALTIAPDPAVLGLREAILANPDRSYDFVLTPEDGVAEVFYTVARGLGADNGGVLALVYARAARVLRDDHTDATILAAEMLENNGQLELAVETYADVPQDDPLFVAAEIGRTNVLYDLDRGEEAAEALIALTEAYPGLSTPFASLGDIQRRMENYTDAIDAYSAALNLVDTEQTRFWYLYYTRAIAYEREGLWDEAEADFRTALTLNPDQPNVLNYLGYSLVEQRRNFDEALGMIERAVAARPDSGYIVDSLGWVLYRLGRFQEAVEPMERAVALVPTDPVINDHLGDVYWMVGRTPRGPVSMDTRAQL